MWLAEHPKAVIVGDVFVMLVASLLAVGILRRVVRSRIDQSRRSQKVAYFVGTILVAAVPFSVVFFSSPTDGVGGVLNVSALLQHRPSVRRSNLFQVTIRTNQFGGPMTLWLRAHDHLGFKRVGPSRCPGSRFDAAEAEAVGVVAGAHVAGHREVRLYPADLIVSKVLSAKSRVRVGDRLLAIDGHPVETAVDYLHLILSVLPVDQQMFTIKVHREGHVIEVKQRRASTGRAGLGFCLETANKPTITGSEFVPTVPNGQSGNSNGLVTALATVEALGGLPKLGGDVVVTGAVSRDGFVVPIGDADLKAVAAHRHRACAFLVPSRTPYSDNEAEAKSAHEPGLLIIPVSTLDEAIAQINVLAKGTCR